MAPWLATTSAAYTPRTGFVTLQFDDTHDLHYTHIFPILETYGFKGSFGYIIEVSALGIEHDAWKMVEMYQAGHEVQDHTTRHDYMWTTHVDTVDDGVKEWIPYTFAGVATWDSLCQRSLYLLDSLGMEGMGWNYPGGGGTVPGHPGWHWYGWVNDSMYTTVSNYYPYAIGAGIYPHTAHLNLRGHNCPDRFPFFSVPHVTIDGVDIGEIKQGIADAVASGLWYIAVSHAINLGEVARVESVCQWLYANDIEVLRCVEGWQRIADGVPDPFENQLPQAAMRLDLDGNGKPDGFTGYCALDTTNTPPVPDAGCMQVFGDAEFFCYGPEVGRNAFSIWMKSTSLQSTSARIILIKADFEWEDLGQYWTTVEVPTGWTRFDSLLNSTLLVDVEAEVDRIRCIIRPLDPDTLLVAYPDLRLVPVAGVAGIVEEIHQAGLRIVPNPVMAGHLCSIERASRICIYDVQGRCILCSPSEDFCPRIVLDTRKLAPGVYLVRDPDHISATAKIVIFK